MRTAGDSGGAALLTLGRRRVLLAQRPAGDAHDPCGPRSRDSTRTLLMNDITGSPCWFTPVLRMEITPQPGRLLKVRVSTTSAAYEMVSPTETGLSHLRSRNPGEGPSWATASPRARRSSSSRRRKSISSRIQTQAVCQPEAQSRPKCERAAAASSRWNGCGSNRAAKPLMSSAVKVWRPISLISPTPISSKYFIAHSPPSAAFSCAEFASAPPEHRIHDERHHRLVSTINEFEPEFDEPHIRPATRGTCLEHGRASFDSLAGAYRREPVHFLHARRPHEACVADEVVA